MQDDHSHSRDYKPNPGDAEDPRFDELLRGAMQARPEPAVPLDLAARAMKMARVEDRTKVLDHARLLARQRWWAQISGLAAAVLIVAMLAGAAHRMWSRGDIAALTGGDSSDTSTSIATDTDSTGATSTATSTSSTTNTIAIVFVAELLVLAVVLMSISRTGPTAPFGAEALAGFW
jgi:hypothetical protein